MDVFRQRLEDEYAANIIITAPTVPYRGRPVFVVLKFPPQSGFLGYSYPSQPDRNRQQSDRVP